MNYLLRYMTPCRYELSRVVLEKNFIFHYFDIAMEQMKIHLFGYHNHLQPIFVIVIHSFLIVSEFSIHLWDWMDSYCKTNFVEVKFLRLSYFRHNLDLLSAWLVLSFASLLAAFVKYRLSSPWVSHVTLKSGVIETVLNLGQVKLKLRNLCCT